MSDGTCSESTEESAVPAVTDQAAENPERDVNTGLNPVERLATEFTHSIRRHSGMVSTVAATPRILIESDVETDDDGRPLVAKPKPSTEEIAELSKLAPIIQRLETARQSRVREASSWASLGKDRPDQLGDYRLHHPIGRGGMGVVFEAHQISLDRTVALKILPRNLFRGQTQRSRFIKEAKTVASLHHTNIVPIYGVGFDEGCHYFVMQRLHGVGVDQRLHQSGRIEHSIVATLGRQAASALAHAHEHDVLHRDIKPSNLIVSDDHQLWITDFGVAKTLASDAITQDGDAVGTLRYMAPEQAIGNADKRSDIYSLGLTLYEMLTGRPAIGDRQLSDFLAGGSKLEIPSLSNQGLSIPVDLISIVETAMSSDPDDRYPTAQHLADDLDRFIRGRSVSVRPLGPLTKLRRWGKNHPTVASLTAALTASLLLLAGTMTINSVRLSQSNREQVRLRVQAEDTAQLATNALNEIFDRFSPGSRGDGVGASQLGLQPAAANVLEELIPYYTKIAKQIDQSRGTKTLTVLADVQSALLTIAEIQSQLGNYDDAVNTIDRVIDDLPSTGNGSVSQEIERSRLHNEAGIALKLLGDIDGATERHRLAIEQLEQMSWQENSIAAHELARSHFLISWYLLPGMGPDRFPPAFIIGGGGQADRPPLNLDLNQDERYTNRDRCIEITEELLSSDAVEQQVLWATERLLAKALRERGRLLGGDVPERKRIHNDSQDKTEPTSDRVRAVKLLRMAIQERPRDESLSFELATTLADLNIFDALVRPPRKGIDMDEFQDEARDTIDRMTLRLREAIQLFSELAEDFPSVPQYSQGLLHSRFKLARLLERPHARRPALNLDSRHTDRFYEDTGLTPPNRATLTEALELYRAASQQQNQLCRTTPNSLAYQVWHAVFQEHVAETQMQLRFLPAALKTCERIQRAWQRIGTEEYYDQTTYYEFDRRNQIRMSTAQRMLLNSPQKRSQSKTEDS